MKLYALIISGFILVGLYACSKEEVKEKENKPPSVNILSPFANDEYCNQKDTVLLSALIADDDELSVINWSIQKNADNSILIEGSETASSNPFLFQQEWLPDLSGTKSNVTLSISATNVHDLITDQKTKFKIIAVGECAEEE